MQFSLELWVTVIHRMSYQDWMGLECNNGDVYKGTNAISLKPDISFSIKFLPLSLSRSYEK